MKKIKNKKQKIIIAVTILLIGLIPILTIYNLNNPTTLNKIIANKIYKEPANKNFKDDNLYNCIIDRYNIKNKTSLPYTTNLTDEQLLTITELSCWGLGKKEEEKITNASGIEKLTNLTSLNLWYNNLTTIDISKNTNLTYLKLYNNNLSTIDVSENVNLTSLDLSENNLSTIDVSKNIKLTYLDLGYNKLSTIDVSNNINLTSLSLSRNNLSTIDVSNNTNLTSLGLDFNNLSTIDVSNNTNLTELYLYNNNLSTIDLSNNVNLTKLDLSNNNLSTIDVSNNVNLTKLNLYNNKLSTIDVSNNVNLTELDLHGNKLSTIDVSENVNLTSLGLLNNNLSTIDVSNNVNLTSLSLYGNSLSTIDVSNNVNLTYLSLYGNKLSTIDLSNNVNLTYLSLYGNKLSTIDLSNNVNLTELYLHNNDLTIIDLSNNTKLKTLYLHNNNLSTIDLSNNVNLKYLYLYNNNFTLGSVYLKKDESIKETKNIKLPSRFPISYEIENTEIANYEEGKITGLKTGNSKITATLNGVKESKASDAKDIKVSGNIYVYDYTSEVYDLSKDYIYTGTNDFDKSKITCINCTIETNNNKLIIKANDEVVKEYKLVKISSTTYDLNKDYIYTGTNNFDKSKITCTNCNIEISDNNLLIKINDQILDQYTLSKISSSKYTITNDYIYTGTSDLDKSKITCTNCTTEVSDNKLIVKVGTEVVKEYKLAKISSTTYDLSKDYIYTGASDLDKSKITCTNCTTELNDNKLIIKVGTEIVKEYKLVKISSTTYDLNKDYIYTGASDLDKSKITCTNCNIEISNNNLLIKINDQILDQYTLSKISSSKYTITNDYIYTGTNDFDKSKVACTNCTAEVSDNKLIIKVGTDIVKEYKLAKISSTTYNLNKDYIYTGTSDFDKSKITCTKCTTEVSDNKLIVKVGTDIVKEYKLVKISSTTYNLSKDYIYTGTNNFDKSKITCTNCNIEISDNNLLIKINDQILDQYTLSKISSTTYDLSKDDIYLNQNESIDKSKITCTNCTIEISNNKLIVKVNDEVVKEYTIKYNAPTYKKGDINHDGKVNVLDVGKLFSHVRGKSIIKDESLLKECDLNNDGKVNILDVGKLFSFVRGKTKTL